jgi:predicted acyl esterase
VSVHSHGWYDRAVFRATLARGTPEMPRVRLFTTAGNRSREEDNLPPASAREVEALRA